MQLEYDTIIHHHNMADQFRTTISIDAKVADLAATMAEREKRNFSNLTEVALAEYCEKRQVDPQAEEVLEAIKEIGADRALDILRRESRKSRRPAGTRTT